MSNKIPSRRNIYYKGIFLFSAIYDLSLGVIFTFFYRFAYSILGILNRLPDFGGYFSLIGAFLFVIGIAYLLIYRSNLLRNKDLILVGCFYKLAYCSVAIVYLILGDIPHILFVALFGVVDLILFILMFECYLYIKKIIKE